MHTIIIAEAGVNHNGSLDLARKLIDAGKNSGVDYVKFQTSKRSENVTSRFAQRATYQKNNLGEDGSQLSMLKKIRLEFSDFVTLKEYCNKNGVNFLSTPFDLPAIDFLYALGMDYMKIPSGEITNLPYLRKIAKLGAPVIMSTGMSTLGDIEGAMNVLVNNGMSESQISLLHCNTEYPTPFDDVNLKAMLTLKECFGVRVGYSDHTKGIEVSIAAVAMGAEIIEKHFTLDRRLPGPDHVASLEPEELNTMVTAIRHIEQAKGNGLKKVTESERKNLAVARKSIVASKDIMAGDLLSEDNLTVKRPGNGISPMRWDEVIGQTAKRDFVEDELIEL